MKKFFVSIFAFSLLAFISCNFSIDNLYPEDSVTLIDATNAETAEYSSSVSPNIIEVKLDTAKLVISGLSKGKTIWLAKTNPNANEISARNTRYVESGENIRLSGGNFSESSSGRAADTAEEFFKGSAFKEDMTLRLNKNLPVLELSSARSASGARGANTVTEKNYSVGASKEIYIDTDLTSYQFKKANAILRAKGTYCYVWVVDDNSKYWTESSTVTKEGQQINSEIAENIADNFDKIYPMVREVFGKESDEIIYYGAVIDSMSDYSDTGTKVNIVVYDLGADYGKKEEDSTGTVGYFYSKDYYYQYNSGDTKYSNAGKYFYIDAFFSANETSMVYSTLAHEFQHMVDFGVKTMESLKTGDPLQSKDWYNEMKSMLCEDIMKNYLEENNSDFTDEDSPFQRLPMFCRHYYDVGLEYRTGTTQRPYDTYYTYANNYAFGAWAARNYGGVDFIHEMATNSYVDINSIVSAAKKYKSGTTIESMLKEYAAACIVNSSGYGFNKDSTQALYVTNGYYYPMDAINLWELNLVMPEFYAKVPDGISDYYSFKGPVYFGYNSQHELRPYGFTISKVGTATGSEVVLYFNSDKFDNAQKTYIIIK